MKSNWFLSFAFALMALMVFVSLAHSHGWYDKDCCNNQDCAVVTKIVPGGQGGFYLTTKHGTAFLPRTAFDATKNSHIKIRPSKDQNWHACIYTAEPQEVYLRCVYIPAGT